MSLIIVSVGANALIGKGELLSIATTFRSWILKTIMIGFSHKNKRYSISQEGGVDVEDDVGFKFQNSFG